MRIGVVGAGPSSLYLLRMIKNHDLVAYEEDSRLGLPRHCTGLVSLRGAVGLGIYRRDIVIGTYSRIRILNGEDGSSITFNLPKQSIIMLDRPGLEESLYDGVGVSFGRKVKSVTLGGGLEEASSHNFDVVVVGEGARGRLANVLGVKGEYLFGIQGDGRTSEPLTSSSDEILVIFDRRISPSYFSWIVPIDGREYRAGVTDRADRVSSSLNYFKKRFGITYRTMFGGHVMVSSKAGAVAAGKIAAIGDSTGLNKALTGGGILTGALSAKLLAEALESAEDPRAALKAYAVALESAAGRTLRLYSLIASLLYLRNGVGAVLRILDSLNGLTVDVDDYDNHAKAITAVLRRRPSLILTLIGLLRGMDLGSPMDVIERFSNKAYAVDD